MKIHIRKIGFFVSVFLTAIILHGSKAFAAAPSMIDTNVRIVWEDEEDQDHARPEEVTITLYANGNEVGRSMTLSAENDWEGTFEGLPAYIEDERQAYSVVEEKIDGYTGAIAGSDTDGYTITNMHAPLPKGRSGEEEMDRLDDRPQSQAEGTIVETVVTTKVSKSMPARTSTTIKKTMSAKTADTSETVYWGGTLLGAITALFIWMRIEQKRK